MGTNEFDWAVGYLESQLYVLAHRGPDGKLRPRVRVRGVREDLIRRCAAGLEVDKVRGPVPTAGSPIFEFSLTGKPAHEFMKRVWPMLTPSTKRKYLEVVKEVRG